MLSNSSLSNMRVISVVVAGVGLAVAQKQVPLTLLSDPKARCMDGTLSGYYFEPASDSSASGSWVLFLEGGGECATQAACYAALSSPLGSSKYFAPQIWMPYFLLNTPTGNYFAGWNHVDVPYCSQDLHSGQVTTPSNDTYGLYFSGHLVLEAILDQLDAVGGLRDAKEIILTGASAGGIGVWMNVDYIAKRYPNARVTAVPIAGFYFYAYPYTGVNHTSSGLADFRPQAWPQHYQLWSSYADEDCVARLSDSPWACLLANYSFPYITSKSFVIESQTDQVVLEAHDWLPGQYRHLPPEQAYMEEWSANMTIALKPLMNPAATEYGAFNPACYIHTSFGTTGPLINGSSYLDALTAWYTQSGPPSAYKLRDNCGVECNPTCP